MSERLDFYSLICAKLPTFNQRLLYALLSLLTLVMHERSANKMGPPNLAMVFSTALVRAQEDDPQSMMANLENATESMRFLIRHFECCGIGKPECSWNHSYNSLAADKESDISFSPSSTPRLSPLVSPVSSPRMSPRPSFVSSSRDGTRS